MVAREARLHLLNGKRLGRRTGKENQRVLLPEELD
jgi:hypothetical protein